MLANARTDRRYEALVPDLRHIHTVRNTELQNCEKQNVG